MTNANEFNRTIIEEFRSNGGQVGGNFSGFPLLLLTTIGAKSGQQRTNPLAYHRDGDRWIVMASKAGSPTNPDWFHNLVANSDVKIEVGTETIDVKATVAAREERDTLYARQVAVYPQYGEYENRTSRKIPVVILTRRD